MSHHNKASRPHPLSGHPRSELSGFLRLRRSQVSPEDVGLVTAGRRRTPGLRREEVAVLANVGVSWYTWLEQGRDIAVSIDVLDGVARALRLGDSERMHLYLLAGQTPPTIERAAPPTSVLQRLVDGIGPYPAYITSSHWEIQACNTLAQKVFDVRVGTNCLVRFFTEPGVADHYPDRSRAEHMLVGRFRIQAARYPNDPEFLRLTQRLSSASERFRELWNDYTVCSDMPQEFMYEHDDLGQLTFDTLELGVTGHTGFLLVLYLPRAGTGTEQALNPAIGDDCERAPERAECLTC
jgi:transcriptional regulator with XRE-family HTH domain